jgi:hypothetical protein
MTPSSNWDATSLAWLIKKADMTTPQPAPVAPNASFFGFRGIPATITIQRKDGVYVDGKKVEQPQEPDHGNKDLQ